MIATAEQKARADSAVAEVDRKFRDGCALLGIGQGGVLALLKGEDLPWSETLLAGPSLSAAVSQLKLDGPRIERWAGTLRTWAEAGHKDDGTSYGWERWSDYGRELADNIAQETGVAIDYSTLAAVRGATVATVTEVAETAVSTATTIGNVVRSPVAWVAGGAVALAVLYLAVRR